MNDDRKTYARKLLTKRRARKHVTGLTDSQIDVARSLAEYIIDNPDTARAGDEEAEWWVRYARSQREKT